MKAFVAGVSSVAADCIGINNHTCAVGDVYTCNILVRDSVVIHNYSSYSSRIVNTIAAIFYIIVRDSSIGVGA